MSPWKRTYQAQHPFTGNPAQSQLSFSVGDTIEARPELEKNAWLWGSCRGRRGWFPVSYVTPLPTSQKGRGTERLAGGTNAAPIHGGFPRSGSSKQSQRVGQLEPVAAPRRTQKAAKPLSMVEGTNQSRGSATVTVASDRGSVGKYSTGSGAASLMIPNPPGSDHTPRRSNVIATSTSPGDSPVASAREDSFVTQQEDQTRPSGTSTLNPDDPAKHIREQTLMGGTSSEPSLRTMMIDKGTQRPYGDWASSQSAHRPQQHSGMWKGMGSRFGKIMKRRGSSAKPSSRVRPVDAASGGLHPVSNREQQTGDDGKWIVEDTHEDVPFPFAYNVPLGETVGVSTAPPPHTAESEKNVPRGQVEEARKATVRGMDYPPQMLTTGNAATPNYSTRLQF